MIVGSFYKSPTEVREFVINLSALLDEGDTIASKTLTPPTGITINSSANTTTEVSAVISGGTIANRYEVAVSVVTAGGSTIEVSFLVNVVGIVVGVSSYASVDDVDEYFATRGGAGAAWLAASYGTREQALIRATQILDAMYRGRFTGSRTDGRDQALEWPRTGATDFESNTIADTEIPQEVVNATCEIAVRELASPGSVLPDLERGGNIKRLQAGSVSIDYADAAPGWTTFQTIDGIMASLVGSASRGFAFSTATRG